MMLRRPAVFSSGRSSRSGWASHSLYLPSDVCPLRTCAPTSVYRCRSRCSKQYSANVATQASRRDTLAAGLVLLTPTLAGVQQADAATSQYEPMEALKGKDYGKPRMTYPDFVMTPSGLQYKDLREGTGQTPQLGDTLLVDWDGYTIGYYGRPFEARNKAKGGSFTGEDKDYFRFTLGDHSVIPAFEEAVASMKVGGIRRIVVPVELGYPDNDYKKQGPKPSTFAGERALSFVLGNQGMIDKTLLFDIDLIRIIK